MKRLEQKIQRAKARRRRVKYAIKPKEARYRLVFIASNRYLSTQLLDDGKGITLCSAATNEKPFLEDFRKQNANLPSSLYSIKNKEASLYLGKLIGQRAKAKGVEKVVLDRRHHKYHGRLVQFSEGARKSGLVF